MELNSSYSSDADEGGAAAASLRRLTALASGPDSPFYPRPCPVHLDADEEAGDPDLYYMLDDISDLQPRQD